jgi:ABC-type bacteriocin/lantibiotic exporter with double-glycine peptidase domain
VGERGSKLSGGQRQRLGIARALYTKPKLIVMDEATSSLDAETEFILNESIQNLKGKVTLIIIAHRLATVRNADIVCYLKDGVILAKGTFEYVRNQVPDFDNQAKLLGL